MQTGGNPVNRKNKPKSNTFDSTINTILFITMQHVFFVKTNPLLTIFAGHEKGPTATDLGSPFRETFQLARFCGVHIGVLQGLIQAGPVGEGQVGHLS